MKNLSNRMILYPKDVMQLLGKGARNARHIILQIKKKKGIPLVNVKAFCEYMHIPEEEVREYLKDNG